MHTHIEPLSETDDAVRPQRDKVTADREAIHDLALRHTGAEPLDVSFRDSAGGRIALVTVAVPGRKSLREAHRIAGPDRGGPAPRAARPGRRGGAHRAGARGGARRGRIAASWLGGS